MALGADALIDYDYYTSLYPDDIDAEQAHIETLINAASVRANSMTGRKLAARSYVDQLLDGSGTIKLVLPQWPATAVTLYVDTAREFGADTEIDAADFELDEEAGIVLYSYAFPKAAWCVKASWTGGYAAIAVPEDLKEAVAAVVRARRDRGMSGGIGMEQIQNPGGVAATFEPDIPLMARRTFERYARKI